jgi:hypothetical protein
MITNKLYYVVTYKMTINSKGVNERLRVWNGNLKRTSGGLEKKNLKMKNGRLVSKRASASAKKRFNSKKHAHVKASFNDNQYQ